MKKIALTLGMASLMAAPTFAQAVIEDTDGSGGYSFAEVATAYPNITDAMFVTMDLDASGEISAEELEIAMAATEAPTEQSDM
ncbi:hypothetical protein EDD53_2714 [Pacificibacter maritimus]|uniref:EF-hand domain-containing protein n=1 Tax=Pacificibacter maritimus TaxID=762213 RepID=A0A3N4UCU1_9RHOB|nr:EF-hand domain-containing protein [Pacificibacter maritimus]RPE63117.1 hypothetical protein EDD53_2714 [Pacificibacter maritimus]